MHIHKITNKKIATCQHPIREKVNDENAIRNKNGYPSFLIPTVDVFIDISFNYICLHIIMKAYIKVIREMDTKYPYRAVLKYQPHHNGLFFQ